MTELTARSTFANAAITRNPAWAQLLGLCPLMAVSTTVVNAVGLAAVGRRGVQHDALGAQPAFERPDEAVLEILDEPLDLALGLRPESPVGFRDNTVVLNEVDKLLVPLLARELDLLHIVV